MTAAKKERPDEVSWLLQIQYEPRGPWSDHTRDLFDRTQAEEVMAERRVANSKCRYRLVRVTTTYAVERDW